MQLGSIVAPSEVPFDHPPPYASIYSPDSINASEGCKTSNLVNFFNAVLGHNPAVMFGGYVVVVNIIKRFNFLQKC